MSSTSASFISPQFEVVDLEIHPENEDVEISEPFLPSRLAFETMPNFPDSQPPFDDPVWCDTHEDVILGEPSDSIGQAGACFF